MFASFLEACSGSSSTPTTPITPTTPSPQFINGTPLQAANTVVQAISQLQEDSTGLTPFIKMFDSDGVRFSADYFIENGDRVLTASEFEGEYSLQNPVNQLWGIQDGSGDPINVNIHDYFSRYVWNYPYDNKATVTLINNSNDFHSQGNLINNMLSFYNYSQYRIVEYHQAGTNPSDNGMDWTSLMVVLKSQGANQWSLVGIVHGAWTI